MESEPNKAMVYAHGNILILIRDAAEHALESYGVSPDAVSDVVGFPHQGYDDEHFGVTSIILLDTEKENLGWEKPCVGIKVNEEYGLSEGGGHKRATGPNSSVITAPRMPTEADLMHELGTDGEPLYRVDMQVPPKNNNSGRWI